MSGESCRDKQPATSNKQQYRCKLSKKVTEEMETQYTWKTGLFSNRFEIFKQDFSVGELQKESIFGKVKGEMSGHSIMFRTRGIFRFNTSIIDLHNEQELGTIHFKNLKIKSIVIYRNREYHCRFENILRTRWTLSDENGPVVRYYSQAFKGIITSVTSDEVLILAGFFIRNFLKQRSASIAAAG